MNYFIFDYNKDLKFIDSFLESASLAHQQEKKTKAGSFGNLFGENILACTQKENKIAGCVAIEIKKLKTVI